MNRKFSGVFSYSATEAEAKADPVPSIYGWLNPKDVPYETKYSDEYLLGDFIETSYSAYWNWLGMLRPLFQTYNGFIVLEACTSDIYLAFFEIDGRYFAAHIRVSCGFAEFYAMAADIREWMKENP